MVWFLVCGAALVVAYFMLASINEQDLPPNLRWVKPDAQVTASGLSSVEETPVEVATHGPWQIKRTNRRLELSRTVDTDLTGPNGYRYARPRVNFVCVDGTFYAGITSEIPFSSSRVLINAQPAPSTAQERNALWLNTPKSMAAPYARDLAMSLTVELQEYGGVTLALQDSPEYSIVSRVNERCPGAFPG